MGLYLSSTVSRTDICQIIGVAGLSYSHGSQPSILLIPIKKENGQINGNKIDFMEAQNALV
jgi:hypothetical protein